MSVQLRLHELASTMHVQLSIRMSADVSISMNQFFNFKQSHPSNVGISWNMVIVRLSSFCGMYRVSVYACKVLCISSPLDLGADWSAMVTCCRLSVNCNSSSVGVDCGVLDFKLANWFSSCWNCSSKSAKGQWVSVSSEYLSDESFPPSSTGWSCCMRSKGVDSWLSGMSSVSWLPYLVTMPCALWHIPKVFSRGFLSPCHVACGTFQRCLAEASRVIICGLGTCACCSGGAGDKGQKSLTRYGWDKHGCLLYRWGTFWSSLGELQLVTGEHLICLLVVIFDCPLLGLSSWHRCEGTEWWVGGRIAAYAPCMLTQVLPLVVDSDK